MQAAAIQARTGGDPSKLRVASDDALCVLFGWTPDELAEIRAQAVGTFCPVGREGVTLTFDPSPAVYSGPLGALKPVSP